MAMRLIFGRAGSGKSRLCLEEIRREMEGDPLGKPIILLVPEQSTHQMETNLIRGSKAQGFMRGQVLSFHRLCWRVFSETGGQKVLIGEIGKRMLLRRLLLKHRSHLRVFARSAKQIGTADLLAQTLSEFKMYRITPADLRSVQVGDQDLTGKLEELAFLYDEFNNSLGRELMDPDDVLSLIAAKIPLAASLREAQIWVDGFKGFTPQELQALRSLLGVAKEMTITVPYDPELHRRSTLGKGIHDRDLFLPGEPIFWGSWQTVQSLERIVGEVGHSLSFHCLEGGYRFQTPVLRHLEKHYSTYPTRVFHGDEGKREGEGTRSSNPVNDRGDNQEILLFSTVNRRSECEEVARELRRLAREEGKSWRDLAVLTRDLSAYEDVIKHVFPMYEIPFFLDSKRTVLHHPLLELLLSALEIVKSDWAYEPVFRCLKTGFFPLPQDSVDRLENYCLAHGIRGKAWSGPWHYRSRWTAGEGDDGQSRETEQAILLNRERQAVFEALQPFISEISDQDQGKSEDKPNLNIRRATAALFNLLLRLDVPGQLEASAKLARQRADFEEAHLQEQIWEAVLGVMDELVAALGEEGIGIEDFALVLSSGLENLKLGLIPPRSDQVLIGSMERSRNPEVHMLFLMGANDGVLPARPASAGVLDKMDREILDQRGLSLAPKGKAQLYEEQFFIYTALTRARERLYISYPLTDEDGKSLTASPVIVRLKTIFPELKVRFYDGLADDWRLISHPQALLPAYALHLRELRQGSKLKPLWETVGEWFAQHEANFPQVKLLESSIPALNREEDIPKPLARRLYGKGLLTSVTQLEKYTLCPFAHYAKYGLKLNERPVHQFSSPDMGQFFHAILRDFAETLRERGQAWGALSKGESWQLVNEVTEKILPNLRSEILLSNARYRFITRKLKRTVHHAVRVLGEHDRLGCFLPIQFEVKFGPGELLPGVTVPLAEGNALTLRGQIDRIDRFDLGQQAYLRIIDYKSSENKTDLNQIYYGLDLQLLAYLDAALQGAEILLSSTDEASGESFHPAGFLYFPVVEPVLKADTLLSPEQIERNRLESIKISGYFLANRQVLEAMDRELAKGKSSLLGLATNKDGSFRKNTPTLSEEQFQHLRQHLRRYLQRAGDAILGGHIAIAPYRQGNRMACTYCQYNPVCRFDPGLPENSYRHLPKLDSQTVWSLLESAAKAEMESPVALGPGHGEAVAWLGEQEDEPDRERRED